MESKFRPVKKNKKKNENAVVWYGMTVISDFHFSFNLDKPGCDDLWCGGALNECTKSVKAYDFK